MNSIYTICKTFTADKTITRHSVLQARLKGAAVSAQQSKLFSLTLRAVSAEECQRWIESVLPFVTRAEGPRDMGARDGCGGGVVVRTYGRDSFRPGSPGSSDGSPARSCLVALTGHSTDTHWALNGHSLDTQRTLNGHSTDTQRTPSPACFCLVAMKITTQVATFHEEHAPMFIQP